MAVIEKVNPSIKMLTGLAGVILLAFQYNIYLNATVFLISLGMLLFLSKARLKIICGTLIPALVAAGGLFLMGIYYAKGNSVTQAVSSVEMENISSMPYILRAAGSQNLETALQLSTRLLAFAGLGLLFALTTDGEQFTSSLMHQCHLKPKFAYGLLAAVNLMPNIVRELKNVQLAYRVRGFRVNILSFKVIFTMMVNSIRWSESVAMALESKGFDSDSPRSYYNVPSIKAYDWIYLAFWLCIISAGFFI